MAFLGGTRRMPGGSTQLMSRAGEAEETDALCGFGLGTAPWETCEAELAPAPVGSGVLRQASPQVKTVKAETAIDVRQTARIPRLKRRAMRVPASSMRAPIMIPRRRCTRAHAHSNGPCLPPSLSA